MGKDLYCRDCGEKLRRGAKFCPRCGLTVVKEEFDEMPEVERERSAPVQSSRASRSSMSGAPDVMEIIKRIRPVICAILALVLLATGWVAVKGEARNELRGLRAEMSALEATGYFDMPDMSVIPGMEGIDLDTKAITDIIYKVLDGKLSPGQVFNILRILMPMIRVAVRMVEQYGDYSGGAGMLYFFVYVYMGLFLGSIVFGCGTIVLRLIGNRFKLNRLFFVTEFILLLAFVLFSVYFSMEAEIPVRPTVTAYASVLLTLFSGPPREERENARRGGRNAGDTNSINDFDDRLSA